MREPVLSTELMKRYRQELQLRGYAKRTIKTYACCLRQYTRWLRPLVPKEAPRDMPRSFLIHLVELGASRSLVDQQISALKFLYVELYGWASEELDVPRPKRRKTLPIVPTREEVIEPLRVLVVGEGSRPWSRRPSDQVQQLRLERFALPPPRREEGGETKGQPRLGRQRGGALGKED